ncbi:hypothetical protein [Halopelagius longus]|uniref:DUF8048 domain-containing protein n=1 Tax=Halopelagius longus TaxID=1236180 RepID=A0A1H1FJD6_9EURY|nr:hypothetical protein [Halopelagius longus]RDI70079.1 hypothetical protein DWB78_15740 [Halopelagius longus]SDR00918.1 hypothetical protein SAMN05216278_3239 [Halopelagius longus]
MFDETDTETGESPIDAAVAERVADETGLGLDELRTALVELNSALIGRHSTLERQGDYETVDGVRGYRVPAEEWKAILDDFEFREETEGALLRAHTEQTRMLFAESPDARERFEEGEVGVVVGVDTAEEF